jgi:Large extracellular alpha-helical protein
MKHIFFFLSFIFCSFVLPAQNEAGKLKYESTYLYTDKDCYVAGEEVLMKFLVFNSDKQFSNVSKVGYVEFSDTEKPYIQKKLALIDGIGNGKVRIPTHIPSGVYQVSAYTRYMWNQGKECFFVKNIAIINPDIPEINSVQYSETPPSPDSGEISSSFSIQTDRPVYQNREPVKVKLGNLPSSMIDMAISVYRNDVRTSLPPYRSDDPSKLFPDPTKNIEKLNWTPEYEGHIITAQIAPEQTTHSFIGGAISFVGDKILFFNGQPTSKNGEYTFYTAGIYNEQELVTSVFTKDKTDVPGKLDVNNPFFNHLQKTRSNLTVYLTDSVLSERYIGAQLLDIKTGENTISFDEPKDYFNLQTYRIYNLDEYTRFSTLQETMIEFIIGVRVRRVQGKPAIQIFQTPERLYSSTNTLVLLDGVPIFNHEEVLAYNPHHIQYIKIYNGRYVFGEEVFNGIISFVTHEKNLPFFQLNENSQLFRYECPTLPLISVFPEYPNAGKRKSNLPDFRHTLYWNPSQEIPKDGNPIEFSFYTSDLCGDFEVVVEGITSDGKFIHSKTKFKVYGE